MSQAIQHLQDAIELSPDYAHARINLGYALKEANRVDEARAQFERVLEKSPANPEAQCGLGLTWLEQDPDRALQAFDRALESRPHDAKIVYGRGQALAGLGRLDEAVAQFEQASQFDPNLAEPHYALGNALVQQRQFRRAVDAYLQAIQLRPAYALARNNLGVAYMNLGEAPAAIEQFREAVRSRPDYAEAQNNLQRALATEQNPPTPTP